MKSYGRDGALLRPLLWLVRAGRCRRSRCEELRESGVRRSLRRACGPPVLAGRAAGEHVLTCSARLLRNVGPLVDSSPASSRIRSSWACTTLTSGSSYTLCSIASTTDQMLFGQMSIGFAKSRVRRRCLAASGRFVAIASGNSLTRIWGSRVQAVHFAMPLAADASRNEHDAIQAGIGAVRTLIVNPTVGTNVNGFA